MRIDQYILAQLNSNISRSHVSRFIKEKGATVNGKKTKKPHTEVREGDVVVFDEAALRAQFVQHNAPVKVDIETSWLIHDEPDFFVINKPPFVTTESCAVGLFPVHRLDKGTSGILVIARSLEAQNELQKQWKNRSVTKVYEALAFGHLSPRKGAIEGALFRSSNDRKKMAISEHPKARSAKTEYEVIEYLEIDKLSVTHLYFMPLTGRTHQIRVHASTLGFPIMGDPVYGEEDMNRRFHLAHQMLHALKLVIKHPKTGKEMTFEAPLPADFAQVMANKKPATYAKLK